MDDESIASGDLGAIKLDESICPPGCRRDLYDLTFNLRSQRYCIELILKLYGFESICFNNPECTLCCLCCGSLIAFNGI